MNARSAFGKSWGLLLAILMVLSMACNAGALLDRDGTVGEETTDRETTAPSGSQPLVAEQIAAIDGWSLGETVELLSREMPPGEGTLLVEAPGDPLDGLSIQFPAGSYSESLTYQVGASPVTSAPFPPEVEILSPLIDVRNSAGYAGDLVEVRVPVEIPEGHFAMAFALDPATGLLEALPLLEEDDSSLTFLTRHFSLYLVLSALKEVLDGDLDTDFQHGVHNWQFTNWGSFLAPDGHCAGQSLSAIYYYDEKLGPSLYGQYDNHGNNFIKTPTLQWDDDLGYRLASTAQIELQWVSLLRTIHDRVQGFSPAVTYYSFALAMYVTGDPQFIGVTRPAGGGHAMIVYQKRGDSFSISDPNVPAPGGEQPLLYNRGSSSFVPYVSGPTAAAMGQPFPNIFYFAKKTFIDWDRLGSLWDQFDAGTVGSDRFPNYRLGLMENDPAGNSVDSGENLAPKTLTDQPSLEVFVRTTTFAPQLTVFDVNLTKVVTVTGANSARAPLVVGENMLGFQVDGFVGPPSNGYRWVGFDWIPVIREVSTVTFDASGDKMEGLITGLFEWNQKKEGSKFLPGIAYERIIDTDFHMEMDLINGTVSGEFNGSAICDNCNSFDRTGESGSATFQGKITEGWIWWDKEAELWLIEGEAEVTVDITENKTLGKVDGQEHREEVIIMGTYPGKLSGASGENWSSGIRTGVKIEFYIESPQTTGHKTQSLDFSLYDRADAGFPVLPPPVPLE